MTAMMTIHIPGLRRAGPASGSNRASIISGRRLLMVTAPLPRFVQDLRWRRRLGAPSTPVIGSLRPAASWSQPGPRSGQRTLHIGILGDAKYLRKKRVLSRCHRWTSDAQVVEFIAGSGL